MRFLVKRKNIQKIRLNVVKELLQTTESNRTMTDQKANFVDAAQKSFFAWIIIHNSWVFYYIGMSINYIRTPVTDFVYILKFCSF